MIGQKIKYYNSSENPQYGMIIDKVRVYGSECNYDKYVVAKLSSSEFDSNAPLNPNSLKNVELVNPANIRLAVI